MEQPQLPFLSVAELSSLIRDRQVSPVEVTEAYLERIDGLDSRVNAFLTLCRDEALEAARAAEGELARGQYRGPMHGIPVAVKDQFHTKGIRTTFGSPLFDDFVPQEDATVVARLKSAGAILLGKLNMTEFGTTGTSQRFTTTRNPWDLERYSGGSSSGSAAATAAFMCATSLGEDTGGSIRGPSSWCGLVGLRPSWGRVSRYGVRPGVWSVDTVGPMSRTVEDCALTLQAIAGHDPLDPYTWNTPVPDYRASLGGDLRGIKVGVVKEVLESAVMSPEVVGAVRAAIETMAKLGASVQEMSVPLAMESWTILGALRIEAPILYGQLLRERMRDIGHDNRIAYLLNSLLPAQAYYKAQKLRSLVRGNVIDALEQADVLAMPTTGIASQKVAPETVINSREVAPFVSFSWLVTATFSLCSIPSLSIPCGFTSEGLPIGLQLGGRNFDEETLLKVAYAYERSAPWHTRRPPI